MVVFPNCKINIGLQVTGRRRDGFHNLATVFYPIHGLHDALEIIQFYNSGSQSFIDSIQTELGLSGVKVHGPGTDNLCMKAWHILKKDLPLLPPVKMHLHKAIPMGAGLGGGSADGAFALTTLKEKFRLEISHEKMISYALELGSDCPFFIVNKPCFAEGRGENLVELSLNLSGYKILLVNPGIPVNTGWAFSLIKPKFPAYNLRERVLEPVETWKNTISNDFEDAITAIHPQIAEIRNTLYTNGAIYAAMSGSGSTVFGIFRAADIPKQRLFPSCFELQSGL